jgi:hypothetical protein
VDFETVGYIGVDAGIVMFVDPCYIVPDEDWSKFCDELFEKEENGVTQMRGGIVATTLHGDGSYPVQVRRNSNGRVVEVRVLFDDEDSEYPDQEYADDYAWMDEDNED